jgi:hypothetical protein
VRYWLVGALLLALASLAAARYIPGPSWVSALLAAGMFAGLAIAMAAGLFLRRLLPESAPWKALAAALLAVAAAVGRTALLAQAAEDPEAMRTIHLGRIMLACSTVVWGAVALLWGTLALTDVLDRKVRWGWLSVSVLAVSLALYSIAPLWTFLGLRINHWTLLGLFGLACLAYLLGRIYRWVTNRLDPT